MFMINSTIPTNNMIQIIFHIRFKIFNHFSRALSLILNIIMCSIIMMINVSIAIDIHSVIIHNSVQDMLYHQKIAITTHVKNISRINMYPNAHRKLLFVFFIVLFFWYKFILLQKFYSKMIILQIFWYIFN